MPSTKRTLSRHVDVAFGANTCGAAVALLHVALLHVPFVWLCDGDGDGDGGASGMGAGRLKGSGCRRAGSA